MSVESTTLTAGCADGIGGWLYEVRWERWEEVPTTRPPTGRWLLLTPAAPAEGDGDVDVEWLAAAVTEGLAGAETERRTVDCSRVEATELAELLAETTPTGVLCLLGGDERPRADQRQLASGFAATLLLIQALERLSLTAPVWCFTSDAVGLPGDPIEHVMQAQLWGFGRIVALELPRRWGGLVDVTRAGRDVLVAALPALLAASRPDRPANVRYEDQVAVRPDGVWVRRVGAAESGAAPAGTGLDIESSFADGTVLITGGTTGIGAEVARMLVAQAGVRRLVLLGRRGVDTPGVDALCADLSTAGAEPIVMSCDIADRAEVDRVLDQVGRDRVRTVIHSAGIDIAVPVTELTLDDLARSVAAKVHGALALDEALAGVPLSAFVLFSSIAGIWGGGGGMGAYAAANAVLDALSAQRRARGLPAVSVAWGPWAEIGMATRNDGLLDHLSRSGLRPIGTHDGMAALATVLAGTQRSVAVADIDWERFGLGFTFARASPLLQRLCDAW